MEQGKISLHEAMEVHEMLNLKTVCITKSKMMQGMVFDQELKDLLGKDVTQSITAIEELQALLKRTGAIRQGGKTHD